MPRPKYNLFSGQWEDENGNPVSSGQVTINDNRTVTQYGPMGAAVDYPWEDWSKRYTLDHELKVLQNDRKFAIPFIPEKEITITVDKNSPTRKNAGASFSENVLDSIAVNAKRAGLPFGDALGIVAQESSLGAGSRGVGNTLLPWLYYLDQSDGFSKKRAEELSYEGVQSPSLLVSNWMPGMENPFAAYYYNGSGGLRDSPRSRAYYDKDFKASVAKSNNYTLEDISPLQHAFRRYRENPTSYNPKDTDYPNKVKRNKQELMQHSPEIREYVKKHHISEPASTEEMPSLESELSKYSQWNALPPTLKEEALKRINKSGIKENVMNYLKAGHAFDVGGPVQKYSAWNKLSQYDKAGIMRMALEKGIYKLDDIMNIYNEFACGGNARK